MQCKLVSFTKRIAAQDNLNIINLQLKSEIIIELMEINTRAPTRKVSIAPE